jgi:hypothetical protein
MLFAGLVTWAFCAFLKSSQHRINDESFERISVGMSEEDVVAILGVPYGQHYSGRSFVMVPLGPFNSTGCLVSEKLDDDILHGTCLEDNGKIVFVRKGWVGEDLSIWILFDEHGKVLSKFSYPVTPVADSDT